MTKAFPSVRYVFFLVIFLTGRPTHNEFTRTKAPTSRHFIVICITAKTKCREFETNIPRKGISGPQFQFPIHVSVSELYIPTMGLPFLLEEIFGPILGIYKSSQTHEFGNWGSLSKNQLKKTAGA
jgi:hypothetical protein